MIIYFSGTGNSRWCAQLLAEKLGDDLLDCHNYIKNGIQAELTSGKPWIFVGPTYAWQLPKIFMDFIRTSWLQGSQDAYFVMTCGGQIGKAEKYNLELCNKAGKTYCGTAKVKMAENYLAMFEVTSEQEEDLLMKEAGTYLEDISSLISKEEKLPTVKEGAIGALLSGKVNEMFNKFYLSDEKFVAGDKCISCGLCEKKCPLGNIEIKDGKPLWKGNCTQCMACICNCPTEAIEYGKKSIGKRRYLCRKFEG